ncbi:GNAT family N-acetyltransferase [Ruminococcus sp.]|uniref:GNAT family N-acetyltransferase n=1 Tax=Ruminococcus sp. TaxID=41978 RepID=UPI0025F3C90A|nr:GNAT family N-acetyltransferase [Ruminococcus sp.]MBQ8966121.1 GNAT family N-acetyltransferase [Ruminococcus sp.]
MAEYRRITINDIPLLTDMRVRVLRASNLLDDDADMSEVEEQSRLYYEKALADDSHTAYLAFEGEKVVGAGGISYYRVMPTCDNDTGRKAYIMNMYTDPSYRRQGIALKMLDLLVKDAKERGVTHITLEATAAGRPLYEKYGFVPMEHEMILPEDR